MFVWIIRLYKSWGEVVGVGTLFWRIASYIKSLAQGKEEWGWEFGLHFLTTYIIRLITPLRLLYS